MSIDARVRQAAEDLGAEFPEAHVLVVAVQNGLVSLFAKSDVINEQLDAIAALHYIADQTAEQASRRVTKGMRQARATPLQRKEPR